MSALNRTSSHTSVRKDDRMKTSRFFTALALSLALCGSLPSAARASRHSEAPGTTKDRLADDTDLDAWVANDAPSAVTFLGNWVPLIAPNSVANFPSFDANVSYS